MSDLTSPTPSGSVMATPVSSEPSANAGTVQPNGQADGGQSAPVQDGFTSLNPNTLPPQLRSAYDNMLRDYKKKTTELSEERKKYEGFDSFKQKAELYEQIASREDFVQQWNDYVKNQNAPEETEEASDPSADLKAKISEIENKIQVKELSEVVDAFAGAKDEKGELLAPDFDTLNSLSVGKTPDGQEFSLLRACIELAGGNSPQEKLKAGYQTAKLIRDQIFEEGRKSGMGKMLAKVRNSTDAPGVTSDKAGYNGDARNLSTREARELAMKGVMVK